MTIDWHAAKNAGHKLLVTLGGVFVFAWLPAQSPLYIGIMAVGAVPTLAILYTLERR